EFLQEGADLDGQFSPAIVQSIFSKGSPVHDGAIVVRAGRITRIGGFLPLTNQRNLPKKLGTRHRAALGLTERCDAVVVAVSEERREVSLVERGKIETFEDRAGLRMRLSELLGKQDVKSNRKTLPVEGLRQAGGLALTFLMVCVLWNLYLGAGHSLVSFRVPVEFRNVPENTVVTHDFDEVFVVRISGKNPLVEALRPAQVSAFIDLAGLPHGSHAIPISEENIRLPPGLEIEQVLPGNVEMHLEPQISRDVPVEVGWSEQNLPDANVLAFSVEPLTVRVTAPRSRVTKLTHLPTVPVSWPVSGSGNAGGEQELRVRLAPLPAFISLEGSGRREVKIRVKEGPKE